MDGSGVPLTAVSVPVHMASIVQSKPGFCPGICRAHGLPHQLVTQPGQLEPALRAARGLNKHSIVEVVTSGEDNVAQHRAVQEQIKQAVLQASHVQVVLMSLGTPSEQYDLFC